MSTRDPSRRSFMQSAAIATVGLGVAGSAGLQAQGANDRIVLAVMGTNGRGAQLAKILSAQPGAEMKASRSSGKAGAATVSGPRGWSAA